MTEFFQKYVLKDIWLKLFSLVLATLAWMTVDFALKNSAYPMPSISLTPMEQTTLYHLPVVILSSAEDVRSMKVNPKEVDVTVRGNLKPCSNCSPRTSG